MDDIVERATHLAPPLSVMKMLWRGRQAKEVMLLITGAHKSLALHQAIECGISQMCMVSAMQMHECTMFIADEDATLELKVKYFKGLMGHQWKLVELDS